MSGNNKDKDLLIFLENKSPRLLYTVNFIFRYVLGMNFNLVSDKEVFISSQRLKLNYSNHDFGDEILSICPERILFENHISDKLIKSSIRDGLPYLEFVGGQSDFDPLAGIFFLISRYEEYLPFSPDDHGRFKASSSILSKNNLLEFPIVDAWIDWFRNKLKFFHPNIPIQEPNYHFIPSYDIDHARAYSWKGWKRASGALAKDVVRFNFPSIKERVSVWSGKMKDPFDIFEDWDGLHRKHGLSPIYFWLLGDYGFYDKNPSYKHPKFRSLIKNISNQYNIGIHPSYGSYLDQKKTAVEIQRLENISEKKIEKNRFHFLRLSIPESYRILIEAGIKEDHSMAYPDAIGFRAGTAQPFYWYDLEKEEVTTLRIHPFQIMDVTLKNYMGLSPEKGLQRSLSIIENIKKYGGNFVSLWHNNSYHGKEWDKWGEVYTQIISNAKV